MLAFSFGSSSYNLSTDKLNLSFISIQVYKCSGVEKNGGQEGNKGEKFSKDKLLSW